MTLPPTDEQGRPTGPAPGCLVDICGETHPDLGDAASCTEELGHWPRTAHVHTNGRGHVTAVWPLSREALR
jgi:hypothetical protein